ncbi:MAG: efflux RND transporter periplasmic adaptor subunit [Polyangiaceae bacterium]|nr:efflux RND transporter periplasmic adaptor subunit [Polyangiaceae bacterium]
MACSKLSLLLFSFVVLLGCKGKQAGPPPPSGPVEVGVVTVEEAEVTLMTELPGRTSAFRVAEVRARVNGVVLKRHFTEGGDVKEGDPLFDIDPAPFEAAAESARATLIRASATASNARTQATRAERLVNSGAGTQQDLDNAQAALKVAEADVASAQAAVKAATINLGFTKVKAPISGRIGRAAVTEGAYAQQSPATLLATIQQLDPMYVDVTWSNAEVQRLQRDVASGKIKGAEGQAEVSLYLDDGHVYEHAGKLQFADVSVDPTTGSISLRALFPNADRGLLPGAFVRARIEEGKRPKAILVPQRAVTRDGKGRPSALVVNDQSKVERRSIVTEREVGDAWLVIDGLKPGDRVIVEGLQKARPDADVVVVDAKEKKKPS